MPTKAYPPDYVLWLALKAVRALYDCVYGNGLRVMSYEENQACAMTEELFRITETAKEPENAVSPQ